MEGRNQTPIVELILVGFGNGPELQPLLFLLFPVIYIVAVAGNLLIHVLVVADRHLHTPMYYFMANLSTVEICYVSTTLPRLIGSLAMGDRTISLQNCIVQYHFYIILSNAECLLLIATCIDQYLATCYPLRYSALMNGRVCCHTILRIPSSSVKQKAFSTCSSHLIVVTVYYGSGLTIYLVPLANPPSIVHKIFSVMITVLIPLLNPLIYCLRNKEVHQSLRKAVMKLVDFRHRHGA